MSFPKEKIYIELFKANWCGHCKDFLPTFMKMKESSAKNPNYSNFVFNVYDESKHENKINHKVGRGLQIGGYPTLMVCKGDNTTIEYDGHRSPDNILKFAKNFEKNGLVGGSRNKEMIRGKGFTYYGNPDNNRCH